MPLRRWPRTLPIAAAAVLFAAVLTAAAWHEREQATGPEMSGPLPRNPTQQGRAGGQQPSSPTEASAAGAGETIAAVSREEGSSLLHAEVAARSYPEIARMFPAQASAQQSAGDAASRYWALLIGINHYAAPTEDTVGSRPDAEVLADHLLSLGWRRDHILLLSDRAATASGILQAIRWLASKTTDDSVVVFHYAGHEKPYPGDVDRDREPRDIALWASDNRLIVDGRLARALDEVRAERMWLHFAACRAGGFDDRGIVKPRRLLTYSSPESELSYEDRGLRHSVFGFYLIVEGLRNGAADRNRNGTTVEEAFYFARPLVPEHTGGRQHPLMVDDHPGQFSLKVSGRTATAPAPSPSARPNPCDPLPFCP